jgi:hypothetical protein
MPVAISRKLEYFVRTDHLDVDVRLFPLMLTADQVRRYALPRTPIKETERRRAGFEAHHGEGAVELDALEALHAGELRRVLANYIKRIMILISTAGPGKHVANWSTIIRRFAGIY